MYRAVWRSIARYPVSLCLSLSGKQHLYTQYYKHCPVVACGILQWLASCLSYSARWPAIFDSNKGGSESVWLSCMPACGLVDIGADQIGFAVYNETSRMSLLV